VTAPRGSRPICLPNARIPGGRPGRRRCDPRRLRLPGIFAVTLSPVAARLGFRAGDGPAVLRWLLELAGDPEIGAMAREARTTVEHAMPPERAYGSPRSFSAGAADRLKTLAAEVRGVAYSKPDRYDRRAAQRLFTWSTRWIVKGRRHPGAEAGRAARSTSTSTGTRRSPRRRASCERRPAPTSATGSPSSSVHRFLSATASTRGGTGRALIRADRLGVLPRRPRRRRCEDDRRAR